jgi:glycosyltransferase involved in cell wall biosynthesis
MKILICSTIFPGLGGIPNHCGEFSKQLIKEGHSVSVFCESYKDEKSYEKIGKIKVHRYKRKGMGLRGELKEIYGSMKRIKEDFDLVIILWYKFFRPSVRAFPKAKKAYIFPSIRKFALKSINRNHSFPKKSYYNIKNLFVKRLEKEAARDADSTIYIGENLKIQGVRSYGIKKGRVIYLGVNHKRFHPGSKKERENVALIVANMDPRKGIDRAVEVAKYLKNTKIKIIGGGARLKAYKDLARELGLEDTILFEGFKKNVEDYMQKGLVFLMTSYSEGFPNVILEAMASGMPCIAFRPDGKFVLNNSDEMISDGKNGFLIDTEKQMADKIEELWKNKELWKAQSKGAINYSSEFSWEKHTREVLSSVSPKVSVIMAVRNNEKYLSEAIQSVLDQKEQNFELLFVDDNSTDKSLEIAQEFAKKDKRIKIFPLKKNIGQTLVIHRFLKLARGEYITFLDGDDYFDKNRLDKHIGFMEREKIDFSYCDLLSFSGKGKKKWKKTIDYKKSFKSELKDISRTEFDLKKRPGLHLGVKYGCGGIKTVFGGGFFFRKSILKDCSYDPKIKRMADHDFWFQVIGKGLKIKRFPKPLYYYRLHPDQRSNVRCKSKQKEGDNYSEAINRKLKAGIYFK